MSSPMPEDCITYLDHMGDDLMVVNAARVSLDNFHDVWEDGKDNRLIQYLAKHSHWTPFGQPQVQFRIAVPVFVARQWNRSEVGTIRTGSEPPLPECEKGVYNEVSRRYVDSDPEFYRISQYRYRPEMSIKQGSGGDVDTATNDELINMALSVEHKCFTIYREMLAMGVAPEQARTVLPMSMMTEWIETGSLAYWARFCHLRIGTHAQEEIRQYAKIISYMLDDLFPVSWPALMSNETAD